MKTNAVRLVDQAKIPYQLRQYDTADGKIDGVSVAEKIGRPPAQVFKTLVAKGASGAVLVFCIPVDRELDLKAAAQCAGEKNVSMLPLADITKVTGYVRGGVSPLAMKKKYATFIAKEAQAFHTIIVSAGKIGLQLETDPSQLWALCQAQWF